MVVVREGPEEAVHAIDVGHARITLGASLVYGSGLISTGPLSTSSNILDSTMVWTYAEEAALQARDLS